MPASIAALPRSAGGLPIPYVAMRDGEQIMKIDECPFAFGQRAIFPEDGEAFVRCRPVFGEMEPSRQREVVSSVRCQVCRAELAPMSATLEERSEIHWLVDMLHEPATYRGHKLALEPWVCDDCFVYALQVCPGLVTRQARDQRRQMIHPSVALKNVLAVWTANMIGTTVIPHGNLEGREPCISYLKVEPLFYQRIAAAHFLHYGPQGIREFLVDDLRSGRIAP